MIKMSKQYTASMITDIINNTKFFDRVLKGLNITKFVDGKCHAEFKVKEEHTNIYGTLHGGYSATLVDLITSYAYLSTLEKDKVSHFSINMNLIYLKTAKIGDDVVIESHVEKEGKTLLFLYCLIKNKNSGDILVEGSHTKFIFRDEEK